MADESFAGYYCFLQWLSKNKEGRWTLWPFTNSGDSNTDGKRRRKEKNNNMWLVYTGFITVLSFLCVCLLFQLLKPDEESTSTQRYIDSRTVQPKVKGAWISVDVTETIKDWVSDPGRLHHEIFKNDPCENACVIHLHLFFLLLVQRIISGWSWASTVLAAPSSHPPTRLFPTRVRSWRLCLQVCCSSFCFHYKSTHIQFGTSGRCRLNTDTKYNG